MRQIAIMPVGNKGYKDFRDTLYNDLPNLDDIKCLNKSDREVLLKIFPSKIFHIWGLRPGPKNIMNWDKIRINDKVLFTRDGKCIGNANVAYKISDKDLANEIWGSIDGTSWDYMIFFNNLDNLTISYEELNNTLIYKNNNSFQNFKILNKEKQILFLQKYNIFN